ncbi:hypothetical protein DS835_00075 [Lactobacillus bombicola]|uniref:Enterocin A Immunity n=2 Tax=Lactobacillus bombicola TaxID=1505723 RepID=A0A396T0C9_9LACO|nr:hypothetical protein DS835_00075 [Lactobacillus bombicola]
MLKNNTSLLALLENQQMPTSIEQSLIDTAVKELKHQKNVYQVKRDLIKKLNTLALKEKLSKKGIQLLIQLNKPNFNEDVAKSVTTWF